MGLDACGYIATYDPESGEKETVREFNWRKPARLQQFMNNLYLEQNPESNWEEFNCKPLELTREHIVRLQELVENSNLPFCPGGYFWGHQFQEEAQNEYEIQDKQFCEIALDMLDKEHSVFYECWW